MFARLRRVFARRERVKALSIRHALGGCLVLHVLQKGKGTWTHFILGASAGAWLWERLMEQCKCVMPSRTISCSLLTTIPTTCGRWPGRLMASAWLLPPGI